VLVAAQVRPGIGCHISKGLERPFGTGTMELQWREDDFRSEWRGPGRPRHRYTIVHWSVRKVGTGLHLVAAIGPDMIIPRRPGVRAEYCYGKLVDTRDFREHVVLLSAS
jgi:hypothetical protein